MTLLIGNTYQILLNGQEKALVEAGIETEANFETDFDNGKIDVSLEVGASLGVGIEFNLDVSISPTQIVNAIGDFMNNTFEPRQQVLYKFSLNISFLKFLIYFQY